MDTDTSGLPTNEQLSNWFKVTPIVTDCVTFPGKDGWAVRIYYSTPQRVEVNPEMTFDAAAKHFWNAVARGVGQEAPFGW